MMDERRSASMARPGNQNALKHGGQRAVERLRTGEMFDTPARDFELALYDALGIDADSLSPRLALMYRNAARLQATADCFWTGILAATEGKDFDGLNTCAQRFGWLQQRANQAWNEFHAALDVERREVVFDYEKVAAQSGPYRTKNGGSK